MAPAAPLGASQAHGVPPHWLCRRNWNGSSQRGGMRSQSSPPSPHPEQEGQRLALHEERSGSFLRIHSYSHPTEEVTALGHSSCPSEPPSLPRAALRARRSSCWQLPPWCPPSQGQHPHLSSLCSRTPTLPVGPPKTIPHPQGWTRVGAASHGFIGGHGVARTGRCCGRGTLGARDRAGAPRMDTGDTEMYPGWALGTVRC